MRMTLAVVIGSSTTPALSQFSTTPQRIPKFSSWIVRSLPSLPSLPRFRNLLVVGQHILTPTFFLIFCLHILGEYYRPWGRSQGSMGGARPPYPRPHLVYNHLRRLIPLPHFHPHFLMTIHLKMK